MVDPEVGFVPVRPDSELGTGVLRRYVNDLLERWNDAAPTEEEVDVHLRDDTSGRLAPPAGIFVIALAGDDVLGCGGLRYAGEGVPPGAAEIKRMWVAPESRGHGLARRLLAHLTELAREAGLRRLVLDTRADLVEARTLYARDGFAEVEPYNDNPFAQVWYAKDLW